MTIGSQKLRRFSYALLAPTTQTGIEIGLEDIDSENGLCPFANLLVLPTQMYDLFNIIPHIDVKYGTYSCFNITYRCVKTKYIHIGPSDTSYTIGPLLVETWTNRINPSGDIHTNF